MRWPLLRVSRALASLGLALALSTPATAAELSTALPHELWLGAPRGPASAREVDAAGTRRTAALPDPEHAHVAWQRRLTSGVSGNVLVDAAGNIFIPGLERVTELRNDGSPRYELAAPFSTSVAAALLADGTRAVLTREGSVLGWSESGASVVLAELPVPPPSSSSALVPLFDGGLLVATGRWLFAFDASRDAPLYVGVPASIAFARQVGARTLIIDERGRIFAWRRGEALRSMGAFSAPVGSAIGAGELLVALTSARTLETLEPSSGQLQELARFDAPGPLPLLALIEPGAYALLGPDGERASIGPSASTATRVRQGRDGGGLRNGQLLVDGTGAIARWAANRPLVLEAASGVERELQEVRCSDPVGLVPAGDARLIAVCASGAIWSIDALRNIEPAAAFARPRHWHPAPTRLIFAGAASVRSTKAKQ